MGVGCKVTGVGCRLLGVGFRVLGVVCCWVSWRAPATIFARSGSKHPHPSGHLMPNFICKSACGRPPHSADQLLLLRQSISLSLALSPSRSHPHTLSLAHSLSRARSLIPHHWRHCDIGTPPNLSSHVAVASSALLNSGRAVACTSRVCVCLNEGGRERERARERARDSVRMCACVALACTSWAFSRWRCPPGLPTRPPSSLSSGTLSCSRRACGTGRSRERQGIEAECAVPATVAGLHLGLAFAVLQWNLHRSVSPKVNKPRTTRKVNLRKIRGQSERT